MQPAILKVTTTANHNRKVALDVDKAKKCRRSRTATKFSPSGSRSNFSSSSGSRSSSASSDSSAGKPRKCKSRSPFFLSKLPYEARELPRPHAFIFTKVRLCPNGKINKKIDALDISIDEFWTGSLTLLKRLVHSPNSKHQETAKEYSEYLEYLGNKRKDYYARVILSLTRISARAPREEI